MRRRYLDNKVDDNTVLLLHLDGDFIDSSENNYTITSNAKFIEGKFGNSAGGSDIVMPNNIFHDLLISDEFTIDYWQKNTTSSSHNLCLGWDGGGMLYSAVRLSVNYNGGALFLEYNSGNSHGSIWEVNYTDLTNKFRHTALVKLGNRFIVFIDGNIILDVNYTDWRTMGSNRTRNIITWMEHTYIDEFRISNIARWTSNFQVPEISY